MLGFCAFSWSIAQAVIPLSISSSVSWGVCININCTIQSRESLIWKVDKQTLSFRALKVNSSCFIN